MSIQSKFSARGATPLDPRALRAFAAGVADRALVVQAASGLLVAFNQAGVLNAADVHTADVVCRIGRDPDERVRLALALTVRALRNGSVCIDLRTVHTTAFDEMEAAIDVAALPWPEPQEWIAACKASPLVADGAGQPGGRPLRLAGGLLYLERYWQQEELVRVQLQRRFAAPAPEIDQPRLSAALPRLFDHAGPGARRGRPPAAGGRRQRAWQGKRARRRTRHWEDDDGGQAAGPVARPAWACLADCARCADG